MSGEPRSILIVKPSSFGDVIHTLPAVALLKRTWPEARLTWVINPEWAPLLEGNPDLEQVVPFPRRDFKGWKAWKFLRWCREVAAKLKPDLAVDFQGLLRSAWIGRASRPGQLVGMSDAREGARWFYDQVVDVSHGGIHAVERYLATAREVLRSRSLDFRAEGENAVVFPLPTGVAPKGVESLSGNYVLLHPFSRGRGKSLTSEQIRRVCDDLAPRQVVLVGRRGDPPTGTLPEHCVDLLESTSLPELIWLTRHAAVVLTVDSGPSHLAAALERPMIAIHTWSDPRRVGPYLPAAWVWKSGRLLRMKEMSSLPEAFFSQPPPGLERRDLDAIARQAISLSDSCA